MIQFLKWQMHVCFTEFMICGNHYYMFGNLHANDTHIVPFKEIVINLMTQPSDNGEKFDDCLHSTCLL